MGIFAIEVTKLTNLFQITIKLNLTIMNRIVYAIWYWFAHKLIVYMKIVINICNSHQTWALEIKVHVSA
jgi:hypothetical protein